MDKLSDFLEEVKWYCYEKPLLKYREVRWWWNSNATNPYHWKLVFYTMFHHYPYSYSFNYETLRLSILKSMHYFKTFACEYVSDEHIKQTLMWQRIALGLIDIILERRELFDIKNCSNKGELKYEKTCLVYVNLKNKDRFPQNCFSYFDNKRIYSTECYERFPEELYKEKAKALLSRIINERANEWID